MRIDFATLIALAMVLAANNNALAQGSSLFNSSGGQSNSAANRSTGGGTSQLGGTSLGGSSIGGSGLRSGGSGQGMAGPQFNSALGQASANAGNSGFIGANNAQNGFIGIRQNTSQQSFQQGNQFQQFNRGFQGQNNLNGNGQGTERRMAPARTRIAFDFSRQSSNELQTSLSNRLTKYPKFNTATMSLSENGILTLKGRVGSEDDRKLAEALMRLEPGVIKVENELLVVQPVNQ